MAGRRQRLTMHTAWELCPRQAKAGRRQTRVGALSLASEGWEASRGPAEVGLVLLEATCGRIPLTHLYSKALWAKLPLCTSVTQSCLWAQSLHTAAERGTSFPVLSGDTGVIYQEPETLRSSRPLCIPYTTPMPQKNNPVIPPDRQISHGFCL